jgi:hypothetical protein
MCSFRRAVQRGRSPEFARLALVAPRTVLPIKARVARLWRQNLKRGNWSGRRPCAVNAPILLPTPRSTHASLSPAHSVLRSFPCSQGGTVPRQTDCRAPMRRSYPHNENARLPSPAATRRPECSRRNSDPAFGRTIAPRVPSLPCSAPCPGSLSSYPFSRSRFMRSTRPRIARLRPRLRPDCR